MGQIFPSAYSVRYMIWKYAIANRFKFYYNLNYRQRVAVRCTTKGYSFYICVRGHIEMDDMIVRDFRVDHVHSVGN